MLHGFDCVVVCACAACLQPHVWAVLRGNFPPRSLSSLRELRDALVGYSANYPVRKTPTYHPHWPLLRWCNDVHLPSAHQLPELDGIS